MVAFAAAALVIALLFRPTPSTELEPDANHTGADAAVSATRPLGSLAALRWAARQPIARFAVALVAAAHAVKIGRASCRERVWVSAVAGPDRTRGKGGT